MANDLGIMEGVRVVLHKNDIESAPGERCDGQRWKCDKCQPSLFFVDFADEGACRPEGHLHVKIGGETMGFCSEGCAIAYIVDMSVVAEDCRAMELLEASPARDRGDA